MPRFLPSACACLLALSLAPDVRGERRLVTVPGHDPQTPYSPAAWSGDLLFLAGAIGRRPGADEVAGGISAQTRQALANLDAVLDAAGLDRSRAVSIDAYLTDLREFPAFWSALRDAMGATSPAGAVVESDLALVGARVEIAMIAARPGVAIRPVQPEGWTRPDNGGSWAVSAGDTLFVSGMASFDPATGAFVGGDLTAQIRRTMGNLVQVLEAAGLGLGDLTRCRVFLLDPRDYASMNETYGTFFGEAPPARATLRARMLHPEARFGVQCVAVRDERRRAVHPAGAPPTGRPFSPAIAAGGRLYLAGMVGREASGYPSGVEAQTRVALARLRATLKTAGLTFQDVVNATVYLTDSRHYAAMNATYRGAVGSSPPPRATVGMALMSPEALVEIQMTAAIGE